MAVIWESSSQVDPDTGFPLAPLDHPIYSEGPLLVVSEHYRREHARAMSPLKRLERASGHTMSPSTSPASPGRDNSASGQPPLP